jgi:mannosyltransferase OCH1-like enzyme
MSLIPKTIYQSWKTKNLDDNSLQNIKRLQYLNPEYNYILYDDDDCRQFFLDNFGSNYANAFDALIPGAFKCDFWRYAILYVKGGIYMDMDMKPMVPFRNLVSTNDQFVSIVDMKHGIDNLPGIYQAFMAARPKHPILLQALQLSFANITTRKNPVISLDLTGPTVMGTAFNLYLENVDTYSDIKPGVYENGVKLYHMDPTNTYDLDGNIIIINKYDGYDNGGGYGFPLLSYYHNESRKITIIWEKYIKNIILIVALVLVYKYRKDFLHCKKKLN